MTNPSSPPDLVPGARWAVAPADVVSTAWPRVERTCRNIGWRFDPWQSAAGRLICAKRSDGGWAADLSVLSIPRQVGKSYLLGCIIFAMCLLTKRLRVIWTSHHTATTEEMYESMKQMAQDSSRLAPHVTKCAALQGSRWRITFANGSRIEFGARERGFGRGKARVGILVLDEFQHISMRALANLTPTTNTADNPLVLCAGTPPGPNDNGEAFSMRRMAAIEQTSKDTLYLEFSADKDADIDDRAQWAKANPSFPKRTPERAFLLNRKILDDESFRREFLGIWEPTDAAGVLPSQAWKDVADGNSVAADRLALGVEVGPDLAWASVSLAGQRADGDWHLELVEDQHTKGKGVDWLDPFLMKVLADNPRIRTVVVDVSSPIKSMIEQRGKRYWWKRPDGSRGFEVHALKVNELGVGCTSLLSGIVTGSVHHIGQPQFTSAALAAGKRALGDTGMWVWHRRAATSDITPIQAATYALIGAQADKPSPPRHASNRSGRSSSGREAVLL